jgi:hypothetical protein
VNIRTNGYYNYGSYGANPVACSQEPLTTANHQIRTQQASD